jgi:hypothetical protein
LRLGLDARFSIKTTTDGWTFTPSIAGNATFLRLLGRYEMLFIVTIATAPFTDVTEKAGVAGGGYGMGVAVETTTPTASLICM